MSLRRSLCRLCNVNTCLLLVTVFLIVTMYLNMMALHLHVLSIDSMRDVNAPLSQEYSLPVRLGQQEIRDSVTYRVLTKEMLEDHKKLDMPSNKGKKDLTPVPDPAEKDRTDQQVRKLEEPKKNLTSKADKQQPQKPVMDPAKSSKGEKKSEPVAHPNNKLPGDKLQTEGENLLKIKTAVTQKKPSAVTQKKPSAVTQKKPSAVTQKKPSAVTQKKPSAVTQKKPTAKALIAKALIAEASQIHRHVDGFLGKDGKIILLWTPLTPERPLWNIKSWRLESKCEYKCQATNDTSYLSKAALVLFRLRMLKEVKGKYLREFLTVYDVNDLPKQKADHQVWVDVNQESPMYSHSDEELSGVDKVFDYIASYHSASDYTYDYKLLHRKKQSPSKPINYSAGKTKMAIWYVSHCDALSGRQSYVTELRKYNITVDIFGKCSGLKDGCNHTDLECIHKIRSKYRFYLAFENSICSEYITEKYWNTLNSNSYNIPVALGAKSEEYKSLSPPNSFLHVRNFTSPKLLAEYMHKVAKDDKLFNSYHTWRESYELYKPPVEEFDCWLCRMAYEQPIKKHSSYSEFWSRKHLCEERTEPTV